MGARRAYWTWGLLLVGFLGIGASFLGTWYEMAADASAMPGFSPGGEFAVEDIDDPRVQFHTDFWHPSHTMFEGGDGGPAGYEDVPHKASVLGVLRTFYLIGFVGLVAASVGLLFRARGLIDGKGIVASLAVVSLFFMVFGVAWFSFNVADAYNEEADADWGTSPEIAFLSFGVDSEDGTWVNVTSGPRLGWFGAVGGLGAVAGAFGFVYAGDLRRARAVLTDDAAAAEAYERETERRRHVLDRLREEGRR